MFCANCGVPNDEGVSFCSSCGKPIGSALTGLTIGYTLASRPSRLGAKLIDAGLYAVAIGIAAIFLAVSVPLGVLLLALAILGIPIYQVVLLTRDGQTIGKKLLDIRIVDVETGQNAGFGSNVVMRAWVNALLNAIPLYGLVDILFIFRQDRRCIHDLIAGTRVVK